MELYAEDLEKIIVIIYLAVVVTVCYMIWKKRGA